MIEALAFLLVTLVPMENEYFVDGFNHIDNFHVGSDTLVVHIYDSVGIVDSLPIFVGTTHTDKIVSFDLIHGWATQNTGEYVYQLVHNDSLIVNEGFTIG
jgi:hypothetical protein